MVPMTLLPCAALRKPLALLTAATSVVLAAGLICGCSGPVPVSPPAALRSPAADWTAPAVGPTPSPSQPLPTAGPGSAAGTATPSKVAHWGAFFGGEPGEHDLLASPATVTVPGTIAEIGTSNSTQYALLTDGRLYAWGMGSRGQLGDGRKVNSFTHAAQVRFPPGVKIAWIPTDVMPYDTGLAVDTNGNVWGWGQNGGGELCTGKRRAYLSPVLVPVGPVTAVAGASNHALYDASGTVYACGQNTAGSLGDGSYHGSDRPVRVSGLDGSAVTQLVASFANSGALLADGEYFDWGYNADGQLGNGTAGRPSDVPVRVHLRDPVKQVAQGGSIWGNGQTLVQLSDGSVWAWGDNYACQLGVSGYGYRDRPVPVRPPPGVRFRSLATGSATSYAISTTGDVYAWGASQFGQIGNGLAMNICQPARILTGTSHISATANNVAVSLADSN